MWNVEPKKGHTRQNIVDRPARLNRPESGNITYVLTVKDTGTEDTISQFGRRNQMSSSNILSIHGLKKKHQFQDSNRDIQW